MKSYTFFGVEAEVFCVETRHPYPWRFRVKRKNGNWTHFYGMPNMCESMRSAMMRAWWRCKWISEGTFDQRYT